MLDLANQLLIEQRVLRDQHFLGGPASECPEASTRPSTRSPSASTTSPPSTRRGHVEAVGRAAVGLNMAPLVEGGDVVEALGERVLGRVLAQDILKPGTEEVLIPKNTLLDEKLVRQIEHEGVDQLASVRRSPATRATACARAAMDATSRVDARSASVRLWVLSLLSRSVSQALS